MTKIPIQIINKQTGNALDQKVVDELIHEGKHNKRSIKNIEMNINNNGKGYRTNLYEADNKGIMAIQSNDIPPIVEIKNAFNKEYFDYYQMV